MESKETSQGTRITLGYVVIAVSVIEGLITAWLPSFPFVAAAGVLTLVYGTYVTGRTMTDNRWSDSQYYMPRDRGELHGE